MAICSKCMEASRHGRLSENVLAKQKMWEKVKREAFPFQPIAHFASMSHSRRLIWEVGAYYSRLVSPSSTLSTSASTSTLGALFGEEGAYSYYPPLVQHRHHHEHCHHCNDRHFEEKLERRGRTSTTRAASSLHVQHHHRHKHCHHCFDHHLHSDIF